MKNSMWYWIKIILSSVVLALFMIAGVNLYTAAADSSLSGNDDVQSSSAVGSSINSQENGSINGQEGSMEKTEEAGKSAIGIDPAKSATVTVQPVFGDGTYYLETIGTVEAASQVTVFAGTSGLITEAAAEDGQSVKKGDVLFILGGMNDTEHPSLQQYKIALASYTAAVKAYTSTKDAMGAAVRAAELQLENARHQAEASYIDYQSMGQSIETSMDGIGLIRNTLSETQLKNERDLNNMDDKIADLEDAIEDIDDLRRETVIDLVDQINNAPDETSRLALVAALKKARVDFDTQKDELESALTELEQGYDTLNSVAILTENQLIGQLEQAQSGKHQLYMTRDSMQLKLGLFDGSSDPVKIAEQGVEAAKAQSSLTLTQMESQLELARISLAMAADQKKYLLVTAPVSGRIGNVNVKVGDLAAPSVPLAQIVGSDNYILNAAVDIDSAEDLVAGDPAEVLVDGKYVKATVKSVSPSADPYSKMVNVKVALPKIPLKPNQILEVRFVVSTGQNRSADTGTTAFYVPLDAVTVGTEEKFIFVLDGDRAKRVEVELGRINGNHVEITSGLSGDEKLIVDGAKELMDGQAVEVISENG